MENKIKKHKNTLMLSSIALYLNPTKNENDKSPITAVTEISEIMQQHQLPVYTDFPSVWICLDGEFTLCIETGDVHCVPGTVVIIPAGTLYYPELVFDNKTSVAHIFANFNTYKNVDHASVIRSITHLLLHAFSKELGFSPARTVSLTGSSFEEAKNLVSSPSLKSIESFFSLPEFALSEKQKSTALSVFTRWILPVLEAMTHIHKNYSHKITGEELAKEIGLCRTNLFTIFKRYLHVSPLTYLVMIRVIRAQFALTHTQYSLQYISDMCGFADCSHMSKCYRQYKGFLPSEDRANMRAYRKKYPEIHVSHDYFFKE